MHEDGIPEPAGERPGRLTRRAEYQRVSRGRRLSVATFTLQSRRREGGTRVLLRRETVADLLALEGGIA